MIDPIDGTIAFSRGIPLFSTLIALLDDGEPVLGLIDLPALDERYTAIRGGGCQRNGRPTRVSDESDLQRAIISHGDPFCFALYRRPDVFERMAREIPLLRGYTDAFGHALVLGGGVGAMVDLASQRLGRRRDPAARARGGRPLRDAARGGRQARARVRQPGARRAAAALLLARTASCSASLAPSLAFALARGQHHERGACGAARAGGR